MRNEICCPNCKHFKRLYIKSDLLGFTPAAQGICTIKHDVQLIEYNCPKFEQIEEEIDNNKQLRRNIINRNIKIIERLINEINDYLTYE